MNKGQFFSIDFLIAMVLMISFLGGVLSLGELQSYEKKENGIISELYDRSDAAAITLTNSPEFACKTDTNTFLAFSFDIAKINSMTSVELKEKIGLVDYNVSLTLDTVAIDPKIELHDGKQIHAIDLIVLTCDGEVNFQDINACINTTCTGGIEKTTLHLRVSK